MLSFKIFICVLIIISLSGCAMLAGVGMGDGSERQAKSDAFHQKVCDAFDKVAK